MDHDMDAFPSMFTSSFMRIATHVMTLCSVVLYRVYTVDIIAHFTVIYSAFGLLSRLCDCDICLFSYDRNYQNKMLSLACVLCSTTQQKLLLILYYIFLITCFNTFMPSML